LARGLLFSYFPAHIACTGFGILLTGRSFKNSGFLTFCGILQPARGSSFGLCIQGLLILVVVLSPTVVVPTSVASDDGVGVLVAGVSMLLL